jgi:hypothetical protein
VACDISQADTIKAYLKLFTAKTLEQLSILIGCHHKSQPVPSRQQAFVDMLVERNTPVTAAEVPTLAELNARILRGPPSGIIPADDDDDDEAAAKAAREKAAKELADKAKREKQDKDKEQASRDTRSKLDAARLVEYEEKHGIDSDPNAGDELFKQMVLDIIARGSGNLNLQCMCNSYRKLCEDLEPNQSNKIPRTKVNAIINQSKTEAGQVNYRDGDVLSLTD